MHVERSGRMLIVHAPAKLNLFLEVLGRRPDGFHELETVICSVGLYDTLSVDAGEDSEESAELQFNCNWSALARSRRVWQSETPTDSGDPQWPADRENLAYRALDLLRKRTGRRVGARVHLVKRIPLAAGLGGGSSDAAAALVAGNLAWQLGLSHDELMACAAELGSDVAFFLARHAAVCRGRGERVEPLAIGSPGWFVIVRPEAGLATADVFKACRPSSAPRAVERLLAPLRTGNWGSTSREMFNALEPAAESLSPEIATLRREFEKLDVLGHQMSGSGTSYFGVCRSARVARRAAARLRARRLGNVYAVPGCH